MKDWVEKHLEQISYYQKRIEQTPEESIQLRIDLLSEQLVYIGKLAAELSEHYKLVYANRKRTAAEAEINAVERKLKGGKEAHGEMAVIELRQQEAEAYGDMKRWSNAFISTKERINALKYQQKVNFEDGSNQMGS